MNLNMLSNNFKHSGGEIMLRSNSTIKLCGKHNNHKRAYSFDYISDCRLLCLQRTVVLTTVGRRFAAEYSFE